MVERNGAFQLPFYLPKKKPLAFPSPTLFLSALFKTHAPFFVISTTLFNISSATFSPQPEIYYGQLGDNLPASQESVSLLTSLKVKSVKLYDANPAILHALQNTRLQVSIMVPNELIANISTNQTLFDKWVSTNAVPFHPHAHLLLGSAMVERNVTYCFADGRWRRCLDLQQPDLFLVQPSPLALLREKL
ncbi:putative glucan endo-1,3-beta-glucosidase A6, partial [Mucuna pruriens]